MKTFLPLLLTLCNFVCAQTNVLLWEENEGSITVIGLQDPDTFNTVLEIPGEINGLPVVAIADSAFAGTGVTGLILNEPLAHIGDYAFDGPWALTGSVTLPYSLITLGDGAFRDCMIESVVISPAITEIPASAFYLCFLLSDVYIPNSVISVGNYAFNSVPAPIELPPYIESVGTASFYASGVLAAVCPELITVGPAAFSDCGSLGSFSAAKLQVIEEYSFLSSGINSVNFPSATSFNTSCLENTYLQELTVPATVTNFAQNAVLYCYSLNTITFEGDNPLTAFDPDTGDNLEFVIKGHASGWSNPMFGFPIRNWYWIEDF